MAQDRKPLDAAAFSLMVLLTALGLHFMVPAERLAPAQWLGVLVLRESPSPYLALAALAVGAGIVLVNLRR